MATALVGMAAPALAQLGGGGLVLSGSEGVKTLAYSLDFNGIARQLDRYRLRIPAQSVAVAEIQINADEFFDAIIDPNGVRVEAEGKPVELREVFWSPEFRALEVAFKDPIPSGQRIEVILSNVRNPTEANIFRLRANVLGTEPNPIFRTVGNWLITIEHRRERSF
ncbi:MAG: DUF2808 domain-containing protein [Thermostichales cyanobacterium BF4_bins_65]